MRLDEWARDWGIPEAALLDLRLRQSEAVTVPRRIPVTEGDVQALTRLQVQAGGGRAWRNNVGALVDKRGVPVRYGLANDSATLNSKIKSADLIGIVPVMIGPEHVGSTIGQFWSRECKAPGWKYRATERERAQRVWMDLINALGGDAGWSTHG